MENRKLSVKSLTMIGVMAALVFVSLRISFLIPLAPGVTPTRIHLGNGVILLSGLLLGGKRGGIAAGIGAFLFDVTDPIYVSYALSTLVSRFLVAWLCGTVANYKHKNGNSFKLNLAGAVSGSVFYLAFYLSSKFVETLTLQKGYWDGISYILSGKLNTASADFMNAFSMTGTSAVASSINAVFGIAISVGVCAVLKKALLKANVTI